MKVVVDASVAIKLFVQEEGSDLALTLWNPNIPWIAPDLAVNELVNTAWKLSENSRMTTEQLALFLARIPHVYSELIPSLMLAQRALEMARDLKHPAYDCFYLSLAEEEKTKLVTADERLLNRASNTPYSELLVHLKDFATAL